MIEVENLTKRYGPRTAVDNVSFKVHKGEILGFLGPNGAGKTTTMRILTGYLSATSGAARVAGYDVFENPLEVKKRIGYLPETPPLYQDMRVDDFLDFVSKIKGIAGKDRARRIDESIEKARIGDVRSRFIGRLSKGYRQRVGLAQAIISNPEVLILDEPTAGLDPKQIHETRDLIKGLGGDHTIVLSTHILPEVSMTCSRVLIIAKGRVVAEDTPDNLVQRMQSAAAFRVEVRGDASAVEAALRGVNGIASVHAKGGPEGVATFEVEASDGRDIRADVARNIVQKGYDLLGLQRIGMSLEDIFIQLTTTDAQPSTDTPASAPAATAEVTA
jgi:ABC-2 type transport system ATP-binding protein